MAVIKRKPCPKSSDLAKKEEVIGKEVQKLEILDNREEKEVIIDNIQETNNKYNLEMFQPALSKTINRSNFKVGVISIVNSKCGKKVIFSKDLMDKLNNPTKVAMSFSEENIAIGVTLPNNNNQLTVKPSGKKGAIYSSGIVSEITDKYGLNFSNRTSVTFSKVDYIEADGSTIAIINVKQVN